MNKILTRIADAYLSVTPDDFDNWLADTAIAEGEGSIVEQVRSAYLAGIIEESWFRDHASP